MTPDTPAAVPVPVTLAAGDLAPDFTLPASQGRTASLAAVRGRKVVLYFYPKANTSGCTREACDFQAALPDLTARDTVVIGISRDPLRLIDRFAAAHGLDFLLASDPDGMVASLYGCWVWKSMYGKAYRGIERSTALIDSGGRIRHLWRKVAVDGHVDAVRQALAALES